QQVSSLGLQNAIQRATNAGIIVVAAAGNDGTNVTDPDYPARLSTNPAISNNIIIVAGAHDQSGNIASFSDRAGSTASFYITGPGTQIVVPDFGNAGPTDPAFQICFSDGTCQVQGTSYSTPQIVGAVALVRQAFPSLSAQQVVQLLLTTADDIAPAGV